MTRKLAPRLERLNESLSDLMSMPMTTPAMQKEILRRRSETRRRLEDVLIAKAYATKDQW